MIKKRKMFSDVFLSVLLLCVSPVMAQSIPGLSPREDQDILLIQATLIVARLEQPRLPRYQFSEKEYESIHAVFGTTSGLSAKVIKVVPMIPTEGGEPKRTTGWAMEVGDTWSVLFQIEKVEKNRQRKEIFQTWPLVEFRKGKIFFLEDGVQVSDGLEAKVNRRTYIFSKDKGWVGSKEDAELQKK
jgi:hypothetical protein